VWDTQEVAGDGGRRRRHVLCVDITRRQHRTSVTCYIAILIISSDLQRPSTGQQWPFHGQAAEADRLHPLHTIHDNHWRSQGLLTDVEVLSYVVMKLSSHMLQLSVASSTDDVAQIVHIICVNSAYSTEYTNFVLIKNLTEDWAS